MPTRWSQTLIPTSRQAPADAVVPSHQLLLRAGYIHALAAGVYDYLPLGKRSLEKAIVIVRRHMDPIAAEVFLPSLQPIDLWERTQRRAAYGDNLFVVTDRHGREAALGPTHEEVITSLVGAFIKSYRDLPKSLYQIQTKFRDEFRPRFGLLRTREFQMKDAYSFHLPAPGSGQAEGERSEPAGRPIADHGPAGDPDTPGTLSHVYEQYRRAYDAIFADCGVPAMQVEAEAGPIGGDASHEFMCPTPTGEDTILVSDKGNYAANVEKCATGEREVGPAFIALKNPQDDIPAPLAELEKVHTPGVSTIEDLCVFWRKTQGADLELKNTLKAVVYSALEAVDPTWIVAIVRGDHEVDRLKLDQVLSQSGIGGSIAEVADETELKKEWPVGAIGPLFDPFKLDAAVVIDSIAFLHQYWVVGAMETDYHAKGFDWYRDFLQKYDLHQGLNKYSVAVGDISNAADGDRLAFDDDSSFSAPDVPPPIAELEKVHTPDIKSIDDLTTFWKKSQGSKLKPKNTLKSLVYVAIKQSDDPDPTAAKDPWYVLAIVPGDRELNEAKLLKAVSTRFDEPIDLIPAPEQLATADGWKLGYVGPHAAVGRDDTLTYIDSEASQQNFWVAGANEVDHHAKGFDWHRDFIAPMGNDFAKRVTVADIRNAVAGDPSPLNDGGVLEERKGIELGHIFKLGDKYTRGLDVTVAGEDNQPVHPLMGCYGIGVNRILAAAIERDGGHDDAGIVWPVALAPYHVVITPIKYAGDVKDTVDRLAVELESRTLGKAADGVRGPAATGGGFVEVLIDDRDERPGPKFKDADLIGIPVRVTVGDKGLGADQPFVEVKARDGSNGDKGEQVLVDAAVDHVVGLLGKLSTG